MSVDHVLTAIQNSALAHAISKTDHLVGAGLQIAHVVGLILFLASLVLISLRAAGWVLTAHGMSQVARDASRLLWAGFAVTALSGTLMFMATPRLYYYNPVFGIKMVLLLVGVGAQLILFRSVVNDRAGNTARIRIGMGLCVTCWFAVAL